MWSERYATQPEILRYVHHVVERFDLRKHIRFDCSLVKAQYNEESGRWLIQCNDGTQWSAQFLILAMGQLSAPKTPAYPGLDQFQGQLIHSALWPKEVVHFEGKKVAIIGTGSSGMQMTPEIGRAHV